jgi:polyisoprenoid-binding protein YceI
MTATFDPAPAGALTDLSGTYSVDVSHSRLGFQARHAMVTNVRGHFEQFEGTATLDQSDPAKSSAEVTVQVASITTSNQQRDDHLRSGDFFDVATHPAMTFRSTSIQRTGDDTYQVSGDLTIRDVTKPVTVDLEFTGAAKDPWGQTRIGFEGSAVLNRKDWGLVWNTALETGGVLVSEKIKIDVELSLVKNA